VVSTKPSFVVISSLAKDVLIYGNGLKEVRSGGPAYWISKTLKDLKVPYRQVLAKPEAEIEIRMPEEKGIIKSVGRVKINHPIQSKGIIISTIGNEFNLVDLNKFHGTIALDIQGFARTSEKGKIDFQKTLKRITILKATKSELGFMNAEDVCDQKKRLLLVTRGIQGFEVFYRNQRHIFVSSKKKVFNTIGAGDVLLTAFLVKFLETKNPKSAGLFALDYVTKFIENKNEF